MPITVYVLIYPDGKWEVDRVQPLSWIQACLVWNAVIYPVEIQVPLPLPKPTILGRIVG